MNTKRFNKIKNMRKIHVNNDDNYATPPELYNELDNRFNFDFDPCPYNEGEIINDGLEVEWGESNFVNPPYSLKLKELFVKKGIEEMKKGKLCVFLIPVSTSTKLFHEIIKPNATSIEFVKGRIKFGKRDKNGNFYLPLNKKGKTQSGTKDSMIVIFDGLLPALSLLSDHIFFTGISFVCGTVILLNVGTVVIAFVQSSSDQYVTAASTP